MLEPEEQHALYKAVRDGDIVLATPLLKKAGGGDLSAGINSKPFDALWHEPGPECTPLHLAAACLQIKMVEFLTANGANVKSEANGRKPIDVVESIDLFAQARAEHPELITKVKEMLLLYD